MSILSSPHRQLQARLIRVGDFTTFNGFRNVTSVGHEWVTEGRGKNRSSNFRNVGLGRADGTVDKLDPALVLKVYREGWDA